LSQGLFDADNSTSENILYPFLLCLIITLVSAMLPLSGAEKGVPISLKQDEVANLQQQLLFADVNVSFLSLFRYATKSELVIIAISTVFALAAGAIAPLPPVSIPVLTLDIVP
jgi:hypothetical protein